MLYQNTLISVYRATTTDPRGRPSSNDAAPLTTNVPCTLTERSIVNTQHSSGTPRVVRWGVLRVNPSDVVLQVDDRITDQTTGFKWVIDEVILSTPGMPASFGTRATLRKVG